MASITGSFEDGAPANWRYKRASRHFLALVTVALSCSGCIHTTGSDFPRSAADEAILGQTTQSQILSMLGAPMRQSTNVVTTTSETGGAAAAAIWNRPSVAGSFTYLTYSYSRVMPPIFGGANSEKSATFAFWNDVLESCGFSSNFPQDSSNFDETRVRSIVKGHTTEAEIVSIFGAPSGRAVYPFVAPPVREKIWYSYRQFNSSTRQMATKQLEILIDGNGRTIDYRFNSASEPVPEMQVPMTTTTYTPIFIHHK